MRCCGMVTPWFVRIGFGVALAAYGVAHYRFIGSFVPMAVGPFQGIPFLATIVWLLAYIVPGLQIVGGVLVAVRQFCSIAKFCVLAALGGIIGWAGLAIMVGPMEIAQAMSGAILNATVFLVLYVLVKKFDCCGSACLPNGGKAEGCCK